VSRSIKYGSIHPLPHTPLCGIAGQDKNIGVNLISVHFTLTEFCLIALKYLENPPLGLSRFPCNMTRDLPRLSFHGCNCGIYIDWCSYSPWATCIHVCHTRYTSCLPETLLQLSKHASVWMTSTRITI
jgi:hypothetical protein